MTLMEPDHYDGHKMGQLHFQPDFMAFFVTDVK